MHDHAWNAVAQMLQTLPAPTRVLEIGAHNINGSVRPLFAGCAYWGIDVVGGPDVDEVASGVDYTPRETPDCVVCCEVLEHTPEARAIVANMARIVAPGGAVIVTCAGEGRAPHSAVDGCALRPGEYYRNVTRDELLDWMHAAGLREVYVEHFPGRGDLYGCGVKA